MLARNALRYLRGGDAAPAELVGGASPGSPTRSGSWPPATTTTAATRTCGGSRATPPARAAALAEQARDLGLAEVVVQVRSVAVDLLRAAELAAGEADTSPERPTDELLSA